jgi:hypothetical protein
MRFEPQGARHNGRIYSYLPPPSGFIATAMHLAMMSSTQGHSELIADLSAECPALRESQVVGITGLAAANETRLLGHMSNVLAVANPTRFRQCQHALIDRLRSQPVLRLRCRGALHCRGLHEVPCPLRVICVRRG